MTKSENEKVRSVVNAQRNTVSVGYGSGVAGVTVRDNHLRTVQVPLTISEIDTLIEELQTARAHLEFESVMQSIKGKDRPLAINE
jgi:hypothetical protein